MIIVYYFLVLLLFCRRIQNMNNKKLNIVTHFDQPYKKKPRLQNENNDLQYVSNMMKLLRIVNERNKVLESNFQGLKENALVFWRNYPEYINIDNEINSFNRIHLLDVKKMVRKESKVCSVDGLRKKGNKEICDMVHFCTGTVQHSWNMKLALQVLNLESGKNKYDLEGNGTFRLMHHNAYHTDPSHCTKSTCNGFEEDPRYRCKSTNETKYEWFSGLSTSLFSAAFKNKKLCFYGDSLSAGQSQTLENEMRSRTNNKSSTNMKKKYGNVSFNPSHKRAYYLNKLKTFDKPPYKKAWTFYECVFADSFQDINTCDIVVLNSALFWRNSERAQSVGRVQKFNPS